MTTDINQHIHVARDGTRTTHDEANCPFIEQYGPYRGKRTYVGGIINKPKREDTAK